MAHVDSHLFAESARQAPVSPLHLRKGDSIFIQQNTQQSQELKIKKVLKTKDLITLSDINGEGEQWILTSDQLKAKQYSCPAASARARGDGWALKPLSWGKEKEGYPVVWTPWGIAQALFRVGVQTENITQETIGDCLQVLRKGKVEGFEGWYPKPLLDIHGIAPSPA
jgi:hypothetical protein